MNLTVDPLGTGPLHRQVYDGIRRAILAAELQPGVRLPATRVLAEQLAVSRTTVAEAYDQLRAEGYVEGRHGSGTFVAFDLPTNGRRLDPAGVVPATRPPLRLSDWGRRIAAGEEVLPSPSRPEQRFHVDFRPHRVAQDLFPWDAWRAAVERAIGSDRRSLLVYPPPAGHPDLLEAIAAHVAEYRTVHCSPDQIVIVNGTQQGLNLLTQLLVDRGDRVAVEDPGYPAARLVLEARGLEVLRVPVDADGMVVEGLANGKPVRLIHVTPSHQEPTGATLSLARRLTLLDMVERMGSIVLEDDYDSEFRYEGRPVESLQGLDRTGLVVYAGTFSKSVFAGLRLGFLVLPHHLVEPLVAAKRLWDSGTPMLEQAALAEFMRSGEFERHIRRVRRVYRARRDALVTALRSSFGSAVSVGEAHGGLNVLVELDLPLSDGEIATRAGRAGIGLRSAASYYSRPPAQPTFLMGFSAENENTITAGVDRLAAALT